jgi:DNA-binding MarR family transcriptional regulator
LRDTTLQVFPDDDLHRLLRRIVQSGLLEPHDHDGVVASASEVFAIGELAEGGPLTQRELGDRLGLEKSTVSRLAAGLQERGWLLRERDPGNRRYYRLALTDEGRAVAVRFGRHLRRGHDVLLAALSEQERAGLTLGLTGLARAMDAARAAGDPCAVQPVLTVHT